MPEPKTSQVTDNATPDGTPSSGAGVLTGHMGDIMSSRQSNSTLLGGGFSPLERVVLTSNGNLQRILSAYFNAVITVDIAYNTKRPESTPDRLVFDREVNILCHGMVCCNAKSIVTVLYIFTSLVRCRFLVLIHPNTFDVGHDVG
ncbi:hypothetical protein HK102_001147 [Quaeritorhiza haematococci]|nr:hypothetical protein HK102_001147 [Quaeritorhiza haematococci]